MTRLISTASILLLGLLSFAAPALSNIAVTPKWRALLNAVAEAEGTHDRYDVVIDLNRWRPHLPLSECRAFIGGFPDNDHPRHETCQEIACSTAAGRYLVLSHVWDSYARKYGIRDFSPASQDQVAIRMMIRLEVDANAITTRKQFWNALQKLGNEWSGLPGGREEFRGCASGYPSFDSLWAKFPK